MQPLPRRSLLQDPNRSERFIPNRSSSNLKNNFDKIHDEEIPAEYSLNDSKAAYSVLLQRQFCSASSPHPSLLKFSRVSGKENKSCTLSSPDLYEPLLSSRRIPKTPYKILDAPSLADDFYLNLLDWSESNYLVVGLACSVYVWNACTSKVSKLCDLSYSDSITSVASSATSDHIAVGTRRGSVLLWDLPSQKCVRTLTCHNGRVGTSAWNSSILSSGSRDRQIINRDVRAHSDVISRLNSHKQEVCGLKWSADSLQLGSGGNDNKLILWNLHSNKPVMKFAAHCAVKAIAWSPHQHGLLASGGGTADKSIKFWNSLTGEEIASVDTGSQVCNLVFSKNTREIVSTHGYSMNQIVVWKDFKKIATLTGHGCRVLYLALSPDGQKIVTGAGDETLRFWDVFPCYGPGYFEKNKSMVLLPFDIR